MTDCVPPTNCVCVVLRPFLSLFIVVTAESGVVSTDDLVPLEGTGAASEVDFVHGRTVGEHYGADILPNVAAHRVRHAPCKQRQEGTDREASLHLNTSFHCEANAGQEVACGLVVAGGDSTPVFELAEGTLDDVAQPVGDGSEQKARTREGRIMGEAKRRKLAGTYPLPGALEEFQGLDGQVGVTLDLGEGEALTTCVLEAADMPGCWKPRPRSCAA